MIVISCSFLYSALSSSADYIKTFQLLVRGRFGLAVLLELTAAQVLAGIPLSHLVGSPDPAEVVLRSHFCIFHLLSLNWFLVWLWNYNCLFHSCLVPNVLDVNFPLEIQTNLFYKLNDYTQTWKLDPHPLHMFAVKFLHGLKHLLQFVSPVRSNLLFDEMGQAFIYCSSWAHRPGLKAWVILIAPPSFLGVPLPLQQSEANPFSVLRFFFDWLSYCYFMLIRNSSPPMYSAQR